MKPFSKASSASLHLPQTSYQPLQPLASLSLPLSSEHPLHWNCRCGGLILKGKVSSALVSWKSKERSIPFTFRFCHDPLLSFLMPLFLSGYPQILLCQCLLNAFLSFPLKAHKLRNNRGLCLWFRSHIVPLDVSKTSLASIRAEAARALGYLRQIACIFFSELKTPHGRSAWRIEEDDDELPGVLELDLFSFFFRPLPIIRAFFRTLLRCLGSGPNAVPEYNAAKSFWPTTRSVDSSEDLRFFS